MKQLIAVLGDYYHPFEAIKKSLSQVLELPSMKEKYQVEIVESEDLTAAIARKPDTVILFKEDRINPNGDEVRTWMTYEMEETIAHYVKEGGGWLAWHSGLASYRRDGVFTGMLRGYFDFHPEINQQVTYRTLNKKEQSQESVFEILDEHYFVYCDEANTDIILESESIDGKAISGWRHRYGEGRVCCFTPAHRPEGLLHPGVISLLAENIRWCCNDSIER
jgi:type 1 glutamine amidotransferase